ncbi:MAG: hypothetical protein RLZZ299_1561 [Pseudomonadota bacterium]|jgi:GTP-binding protein
MPAPTRFLGSFTDTLPAPGLPEVAFAGRSNVGKSSAINSLVGVSGLARVAKTPGRTQALNFFSVQDRWIAVDLPGYGYARVSHSLRDGWKDLIEGYLGGRPSLRLVVALIDARLPPQDADRRLLDGLREARVPTLVLATKIDAIARTRQVAAVRALAAGHGIPTETVLGYSSHDGTGKDAALSLIHAATRR